MSGYAVEKRGIPWCSRLAPAPHRGDSAALNSKERRSCPPGLFGGRAYESGPESIEDMSLGLLHDSRGSCSKVVSATNVPSRSAIVCFTKSLPRTAQSTQD